MQMLSAAGNCSEALVLHPVRAGSGKLTRKHHSFGQVIKKVTKRRSEYIIDTQPQPPDLSLHNIVLLYCRKLAVCLPFCLFSSLS